VLVLHSSLDFSSAAILILDLLSAAAAAHGQKHSSLDQIQCSIKLSIGRILFTLATMMRIVLAFQTDKASMLDEAIEYIKMLKLQLQVCFWIQIFSFGFLYLQGCMALLPCE
jgi:hypothetical protein